MPGPAQSQSVSAALSRLYYLAQGDCMRISALRLHKVKRLASRSVAIQGIGDVVNLLSVANEFGKPTSFEALFTWRTVSCPLFIISYGRAGAI